jgi:hypothetical protein
VPMALVNLWGSFFSRIGGAAMTQPFRRGLFSPVGLNVGEPIAPEHVTPEGLHAQVAQLLNATPRPVPVAPQPQAPTHPHT